MEKWFDYKELQFNVGDTFRYFQRMLNTDTDVEYPVLFIYQSDVRGTMGCLEPDIEFLEARSGQYDVGQSNFTLPTRWYGYPEIYVPKEAHSVQEYGRRLFDPISNVWDCCIGWIRVTAPPSGNSVASVPDQGSFGGLASGPVG